MGSAAGLRDGNGYGDMNPRGIAGIRSAEEGRWRRNVAGAARMRGPGHRRCVPRYRGQPRDSEVLGTSGSIRTSRTETRTGLVRHATSERS